MDSSASSNADVNAFLCELGLENETATDVRIIALEAACFAVLTESGTPVEVANAAGGLLPPNATPLERGIAIGAALVLASRL